LGGSRLLRHNQEFPGARTSDIPDPFTLAREALIVGVQRQLQFRRRDIADHPVKGVIRLAMHELFAASAIAASTSASL
jgi:hypothetical protein